MSGALFSRNTRIALRLSIVGLVAATASFLVFWPWKNAPSSLRSPHTSGEPAGNSPGPDRVSPHGVDTVIQHSVVSLESIPAPEDAASLAADTVVASLLQNFSQLEAIMRRLGGDYALTEREYEPSRRWLRSMSPSSRPEFAATMTQREWEARVDDATVSELIRISVTADDTSSPVRAVDAERIRAEAVNIVDRTASRSVDATLRTMAREAGFANADTAQIVGFRGRLRYRPANAGEPPPSQYLVVYVPGTTVDDRDFVSAYIFAHRDSTDWFPYFVRSLSQHSQSTPPQRRIPFVPAF